MAKERQHSFGQVTVEEGMGTEDARRQQAGEDR